MLRRAFNTFLIPKYAAEQNATPSARVKTENWDLLAGVLVERLPILSKTLTPQEKEFQAYLSQLEFENSLKSDFELREEKDKLIAEAQKKGSADIDIDTISQQTAQDLKDAWKDELSKYELKSRETLADKMNDLKSNNRDLENCLFLLVEQSIGKKSHLLLPQGKREEGETMRQCAERVLRTQCGDQLQVQFYGNAPCGFYKYKYPVNDRKDTVGAKVFFYRSAYRTGTVDGQKSKRFEWLNEVDLEKRLNESYFRSISAFLL